MEFDEKFGEWKEGATDQDDYRHWNDAEDLERLNWNQNSDCAIPVWSNLKQSQYQYFGSDLTHFLMTFQALHHS